VRSWESAARRSTRDASSAISFAAFEGVAPLAFDLSEFFLHATVKIRRRRAATSVAIASVGDIASAACCWGDSFHPYFPSLRVHFLRLLDCDRQRAEIELRVT
jgi:hypothetical protein